LEPITGGRSGKGVKEHVGPPNSAIPIGPGGRIGITDENGNVIKDITPDRTKTLDPTGRSKPSKAPPTEEELELLNEVNPPKDGKSDDEDQSRDN
jgi:hypothetical protein